MQVNSKGGVCASGWSATQPILLHAAIVEDDNSVTSELNERYAILLSPHVIQAAMKKP